MMVFVEREGGKVVGVFANLQPEYAEEYLADDHPDVVAFSNPPQSSQAIVLYPVALWSRMTNAEAERVEAAMMGQPIRVQNIFRAASSYRSDHELWPLLQSVAVGLFGETRAAEILAASSPDSS